MILFTLIWIIIWLLCAGSYVAMTSTETETENGGTETSSNANGFVIFLLFISLYWVIQVNSNVSHTTSCGVAASWYFSPAHSIDISNRTMPAFKRSMTTSFGAMIEMAEGRKDGNAIVLCLLKCCVVCIQRCIEWFNKYALQFMAQVL